MNSVIMHSFNYVGPDFSNEDLNANGQNNNNNMRGQSFNQTHQELAPILDQNKQNMHQSRTSLKSRERVMPITTKQ